MPAIDVTQSAPSLGRRWLKPAVFAAALSPLIWLIALAATGGLGANPIEATTRYLGDWALRMLLIALAVTPLRLLTGLTELARLRRTLGLFAFFYVCLHALSYVGLDQFFDWPAIWADIVKRVYITIGMAATATLLPLALTSTNGMVKRLGARTWRRLHRAVYAAGVLGVLHYFFMIKAGYQEPAVYAAILLVLLAIRAAKRWP
ncbi:MAG: protein-methionine-sulfoxide reductase heme-binding subunit MsrQ [Rhodospirillaceae bacterium]|nr:protein-methionine-sulfoxide reductase heme-binding subunit MsrQ [Rhodospirillaceae bacterium]